MENLQNDETYKELFGDDEQNNQKKEYKSNFDTKNYLDVKLKPGETSRDVNIRIVPDPVTKKIYVAEIHTHSLKVDQEIAKSGFKSFICGRDMEDSEGKHRCAICDQRKQLFDLANAIPNLENDVVPEDKKAILKQAYALDPKVTYIVRCIDRDHEDEGIKFWRFNKFKPKKVKQPDGTFVVSNEAEGGIMGDLKKLYRQRDMESMKARKQHYNIFSTENGKDLCLTLTPGPSENSTTIKIVDSGFSTPLSEDPEQAEAWINDAKDWHDMYAIKPYDYVELVVNGKIPRKVNGKYIDRDLALAKEQLDEEEAYEEIQNESDNYSTPRDTKDFPF